jgi:hydrogenase small subunit
MVLSDSTTATPRRESLQRRDFLKVCTAAAAAIGLPWGFGARFALAAERGLKPSVIWLHFQECTGCSESLLRTSQPTLAKLILDLISLDYHETLLAAAGHQAEKAMHDAMEANRGKYVCIVEGAIPTKDGGIYCKIGDRTALDILKDVASKAGAIVAIGSCASFGGIPSSPPNPTGAKGVKHIITDRPVVSLPGCPANPYILLGTVLQYVNFGTLPKLDNEGRPEFAYGRTIHEHCPRRAHFDAGRFAEQFGDEGHRQGWCLYKLGCKGPVTRASCSTLHFGDVVGAWPIGIGHPCAGCTESKIAFRMPLHDTAPIADAVPPSTYPGIHKAEDAVDPWAAAVVGAVAGAAATGTYVFGRHLSKQHDAEAAASETEPVKEPEKED